jgi:hypothetical protein
MCCIQMWVLARHRSLRGELRHEAYIAHIGAPSWSFLMGRVHPTQFGSRETGQIVYDEPVMQRESPGLEGQRLASTRPWSSTWVGYYDRASRRRHRQGGYRRLRAEAKRRRRVQQFRVAAGAASVLVLFAVCYAILVR